MKILVFLAACGMAVAQTPTVESLAAKLKAAEQDTRFAKLEALVLREQAATQALEKIRADEQSMFAELCKAAGIDPDPKTCRVDLNAKTVTKAEPEKK